MAALKVVVFAATAWLGSSDAKAAADEGLSLSLPDVDFFMNAAQDPLTEFGEQAEMLRKQVTQREQEKEDAVATLKAQSEENLTAQTEQYGRIMEETAALTAAIAKEQDAIAGLRQDAKKVQRSNDVMRASLDALQPKMRLASKFLNESLVVTDDSNATELEVLRPTTPKPTLARFLDTLGNPSRKVSLLGLDVQPSAKTGATPEELVGTLAQRLGDLAAAGDQGEAQLRARFLADYELGEKKKAELIARKQALGQDFAQKQELHKQLNGVKKHLLTIRTDLEERVKGVRMFSMNGNDMAIAAMERAAALLNA